MKLTPMMLGLGFAVILTGCHENPLDTHSRRQNVLFLQQAAIYAEKQLHVEERMAGKRYTNCMEGNKEKIDCEGLFKAMLQFAKQDPQYSALHYKELTSPTKYESLREDYNMKLFNAVY